MEKTILPSNYITGKPYSGINTFLLGLTDHANPYWLTFKQVKELDGVVRKGEKSSTVIYYLSADRVIAETDLETGEEWIDIKRIPMPRYYHIFNWEQTEGIPEKSISAISNNSRIDNCEKIVSTLIEKPIIKNNNCASYIPTKDTILIPLINYFSSSENYYSTLFHELTHWTGHKKRLDREGIKNIAFGSDCYSKEELIAEMGASFLCGITGIAGQTQENSISYIQNWLKVLENDKKFVVSAAALAQKATNYILNK